MESVGVETKACNVCFREFPLSEYKQKKDSRGYWYRIGKCPECLRAYWRERQRNYNKQHGERLNSKLRERYQSDPEYREKLKSQSRARYQNDPDKFKKKNKTWAKNNQGKVRFSHRDYALRKKYGITAEEFDEMCAQQDGKCLVCESELLSASKSHLDHCHKTGRIRGVLCHNCNVGLGHFKDDVNLLLAAAAYLDCSSNE